MNKLELLKQWIAQSDKIVFFGGAGVSTESGIPDFRSVDGLYSQKFEYPPETIISHSFYLRKPDYFFRFYRENGERQEPSLSFQKRKRKGPSLSFPKGCFLLGSAIIYKYCYKLQKQLDPWRNGRHDM